MSAELWLLATIVEVQDKDIAELAQRLNELAGRVSEQTDRLNYFVSLVSSAGTLIGVGGAILAIIIAVVFSILGSLGFTGYLRINKIQASLSNTAERLDEDAAASKKRTDEIALKLDAHYHELEQRIETSISYYRSFLAGQLRYDNSDFNSAYRHFKKATEIDGSAFDAQYYLARCMTYRNQVIDAVAILNKLSLGRPDDAKVIRALALAKRFNTPDEAIVLLQGALDKVRDDQVLRAAILDEIGLIYRDKGDAVQAHRYHHSALVEIPTFAPTIYFLGISELLLKRKDEGIRHIVHAAQSAVYAAESQQLKPIWERTISWSAFVVQKDLEAARKVWDGFSPTIKSEYLRDTILAHVTCICGAMGVLQSEVAPDTHA